MAEAIRRGDAAAVALALNRGVNINALIKDPATLVSSPLLELAAEAGRAEVVRLLLARGADVHRPSVSFAGDPMYSALGRATSGGHLDVMRLLIDAGVDVNRKIGGDVPLHTAVEADQPEAARLLLDAGARPNVVNDDGDTPLDVARDLDYARMKKVLRAVNAKRARETTEGRRHLAAEAARQQLAKRFRTGRSAPQPDFSAGAARPAFARAVAQVGRWTKKPPRASTSVTGAVEWMVPPAEAERLVARHQSTLRKSGAFLLRLSSEGLFQRRRPVRLALLPSKDVDEVVAAIWPGAGNYDMGSADGIKALHAIARDTPFDLVMAKHDALELQFRRRPADPARLARLLDAICPDLVLQGTLSTDHLVRALSQKKPRVYLWWD